MTGYGAPPAGSSRATSPRPCTRRWPRALDEIARRDPPHPGAHAGRRERARVADDRAAHAEGLDRAEGRRRPARRGHVPLAPGPARRASPTNPEHLAQLEAWMRSYRPEELFDEHGRPRPEVVALGPAGRAAHGRQPARQRRRAAARPAPARLPRLRRRRARARRTAARPRACSAAGCATSCARNPETFRVFGPDETASNRLGAVFEATDRAWMAERSTRRRPPGARRPRHGGARPSTSARAGSRATC